MIRFTVHFSGHVQGVGFRYTARNIARGYALSGYVANLPDRRVELVVEGQESVAQAYVDELTHAMAGFVKQTQVDRSPATGEFGAPAPDTLRVRF
jgi:acylphosphatase